MDIEKVIECGIFVKDGIEVPIVCEPEMGDVIVCFDDLGPILLENVAVTDPRPTEGMDLHGLLEHYKADGIFGTNTQWGVICGETVTMYDFRDMKNPAHVVSTTYNISYED